MKLALILGLVAGVSQAYADDNGHPFGIQPKSQTAWVSTLDETRTWHRQFFSLNDFIQVLQQPDYRVAASGESPGYYYVVFRANPGILIFAYAFKKEEKSGGSFEFHSKTEDWSDKLKLVDVLDTDVTTSIPGGTRWQTYSLLGYAALVPLSYKGPLTLSFNFHNMVRDMSPLKGACTFVWK